MNLIRFFVRIFLILLFATAPIYCSGQIIDFDTLDSHFGYLSQNSRSPSNDRGDRTRLGGSTGSSYNWSGIGNIFYHSPDLSLSGTAPNHLVRESATGAIYSSEGSMRFNSWRGSRSSIYGDGTLYPDSDLYAVMNAILNETYTGTYLVKFRWWKGGWYYQLDYGPIVTLSPPIITISIN